MDSIAFPLKFTSDRGLKKHASGSAEQYAQILAIAAQTNPGEMPLTPSFGADDPTFSDEAKKNLMFTAAAFVPEVRLVDVQIVESQEGQTQIDVAFEVRD
jgi:hypothetical protein